MAFLDGDDVWLPEFLSDQLKLINSNGGYDLVYADAINFGNPIFAGRNSMKTNPSLGDVTFEKLLCGECNVITSAVVARRQRIIDVGLFDVQFPNSQDFDLWLRLAKDNSRITYQRKILVKRRLYAGSLAADSVKSFEGEIRVLEKAARRDDITLSQRELIALTIASRRSSAEVLKGKRALLNGEFDQAERAFALAYSSQHNWKVRLVLFSLRLSPRVTQHMFKFQESRTGNFASSSIQPTSAQG
ncbi:MAG: hypothetical protein DMF69_06470 [Acidobacteria bacterium]|nr:MAG: hypothetical protein DMF69_06470 [Acidobacteriota bacterium]